VADDLLSQLLEEVRACDVRLAAAWPADPGLLAHELGHCLGLEHDPPGLDSIMASTPHAWARPTEHDLELVLRGCDGS
jgi:hypothetical protein